MGQTLCHDVIRNGNTTSSCQFEEWYFFKDMFGRVCSYSNTAYQYGCSNDENDHLGLGIIHLITFITICVVYCRAYDLPLRDYTRGYVIFSSMPMVIQSFSYLLAVINANFHWYKESQPLGRLMHYIKHVFPIVTEATLGITTLIFLIWAMVIAVARKEFNEYLPVIHIFALVAAIVLGAGDVTGYIGDPSDLTRNIVIRVFLCCVIALVLIPFVALYFSRPKLGQSPSAIVTNAKTRLLLAVPFGLVALTPAIIRIALEMYSRHVKGQKYKDAILHVSMLLHYLQPLFFAIASISFLPQHRLCSRKSDKEKEIENEIENVSGPAIEPVLAPEICVASAPAYPDSYPSTISGTYKEHFADHLTNPSKMPLPMNQANFAASCPPQPQFYNYTTQNQAPLPMYPQLVPLNEVPIYHQPMNYQPVVVMTGAPPQTANQHEALMSQAAGHNLVMYATVQNVPHSTF